MSLCFSYLWRFWRRKSTLMGFFAVAIIFILGVQFSSPGGKRSSHGDNLEQVFRSTQKRLQQSESQDHDQGVRFLPRKSIVKSLPIRNSNALAKYNNLIQDDNGIHFQKKKYKHLNRTKITSGFKENINVGLQPYGLDNTEYDSGGPRANPPKMLPPVYKPIDNEAQQAGMSSYSYSVLRGDQQIKEAPFYIPEQRIIHFDLKGAPPKIDYLVKLLKWVKDAGATGVLIEYEDMFPFSGKLAQVSAMNHYNVSDILTILNTCHKLDLDVIPLIQTFGHMEFILKHSEFAELRDTAGMPESICACDEKSMDLLIDYIDQVIALHPKSNYIHIGCDEVFHIGGCEQCQGMPRSHIFANHVSKVARYIKDTHKKKVIIWDDMLRGFMAVEMQPLGDLVEPMVWVYAEEPYRFMPTYNWDRLAEVFPTAWTSSAFKGADGPTSSVPNVQKRLQNNLNWLQLMGIEEEKFREGFRGIVITGWQRYDHFAVLSELLPVGVPSLAVNLLTVTHGFFNETLKSELYKLLECAEASHLYQSFIDLTVDPYLWDKMAWCFFPGSQLFKLTRNLENVQVEVGNYLTKVQVEQGWLTDFNIRRNYSAPMRIEEGMEDMTRVQFSVTNLIRHAQTALLEIYDDFTTGEWIEQKIYPMVYELDKLKKNAAALKKRKDWPSRPYPILPELKEFGIGIPTAPPKSIANPPPSVVQAPPDSGAFQSIKPEAIVTIRPKRLVQAPDYYRHPPGSFQSEKHLVGPVQPASNGSK